MKLEYKNRDPLITIRLKVLVRFSSTFVSRWPDHPEVEKISHQKKIGSLQLGFMFVSLEDYRRIHDGRTF